MQTFEKLKAIRKAEGLTQTKFSEMSGIALGTIKNYESGQKEPGIKCCASSDQRSSFSEIHPLVNDG